MCFLVELPLVFPCCTPVGVLCALLVSDFISGRRPSIIKSFITKMCARGYTLIPRRGCHTGLLPTQTRTMKLQDLFSRQSAPLFFLLTLRVSGAVQVIGEDVTGVQGQNVSLLCRLVDSSETPSQISWQKKTRGNDKNHNFFTVTARSGPHNSEADDRFGFIGNMAENNGSLQLSKVRLSDEGIYTCIFTLFPSGPQETTMKLTVFVPPVISLEANPPPVVGTDEVTFAICMAVGAKPPAEISWHTGTLGDSVWAVNKSTPEQNSTTTTVSRLVGIPTKEVNQHLVQCVVSQTTEKSLPFTIQVHYAPQSVNISETAEDVFECVSDASPKSNITWSRFSQPWPQSAVGVTEGKLKLLSLTADLSGLYVCDASNPYGRKSGTLYVHINSAVSMRRPAAS
ncbi:nectin-3 isoform X2 [Lampris incognitus]|uniref:nectin-3 isoform X2 n=1 Tax=Lampris incognitus TaxID=2546036 RepID=UPI0024B547C8|nr:nectin-3 isoform X2 [Lampris incognitus]